MHIVVLPHVQYQCPVLLCAFVLRSFAAWGICPSSLYSFVLWELSGKYCIEASGITFCSLVRAAVAAILALRIKLASRSGQQNSTCPVHQNMHGTSLECYLVVCNLRRVRATGMRCPRRRFPFPSSEDRSGIQPRMPSSSGCLLFTVASQM